MWVEHETERAQFLKQIEDNDCNRSDITRHAREPSLQPVHCLFYEHKHHCDWLSLDCHAYPSRSMGAPPCCAVGRLISGRVRVTGETSSRRRVSNASSRKVGEAGFLPISAGKASIIILSSIWGTVRVPWWSSDVTTGLKILKSKSLIIWKQRSRELTTRWSVYHIGTILFCIWLQGRHESCHGIVSCPAIQYNWCHDMTS